LVSVVSLLLIVSAAGASTFAAGGRATGCVRTGSVCGAVSTATPPRWRETSAAEPVSPVTR
jgi:hypothetical protein